MTDLIDLFKKTLSETLVYQSGELLGEPVENISSAVNDIFPALLGAVSFKGKTDAGSREILDYISNNNINGDILQDLPTLLSGGPEVEVLKANGADILKFLIGDRLNNMIDSVASTHRLRTSSSSSLLKIIATILFTAIARVATEKKLSASGLRELLASQSESIKTNTPHSLSPFIYVPVEDPAPVHGSLEGAPQIEETKNVSTLSRLLPWIVLLIAALGLFYFLDKGTSPMKDEVPVVNQDSLENVRRLDSLRNQLRMDSIANAQTSDSLGINVPDSLNN